MNGPLFTLAVLVILPMIPAFILFKFLPSRAVVKGPLAGLDIRLGGAFGGYVALMVFVAMYFSQNMVQPKHRTWKVVGAVQLAPNEKLGTDEITFRAVPPLMTLDNQTFRLELPLREGDELPDLSIQARGYIGQTVQLSGDDRPGTSRYKVSIDEKNGVITFKEPIRLSKPNAEPAFAPTVAALPIQQEGS